MKKKTVNSVKKATWTEFSKFIRLRDSDQEGICTCVTCGVRKEWREMQSGHGIGGRHNYILFNELINNAQCATCNVWRGGEYEKYAVVLIERHGFEWYKEMTKYKVKQFTVDELEEMKEKYKTLWKNLIETKSINS